MPGVALSTIYNTVHELASLGLIVELMEKDGVHLDPKTELHAHMRCSNCGSISDVTLGKDLEDGLSQAAIASGAKPSTIKVDMVGLCPTCR